MKSLKSVTFICFILFFVSVSSLFADIEEISDIAMRLSHDYTKKEKAILFKKPLAILHFSNRSKILKDKDIGATVTSLLTKEMTESTLFRVIERENISKIMNEIELSMTGAVDQESIVKAGKISGAEFIIMGDVSELGPDIIINARLVKSSTAEVISAQKISLSRKEVIQVGEELYWSAFQSTYGIKIEVRPLFLFANDMDREMNFFQFEFGYRLFRHLRIGGGLFYGSAPELITEDFTWTANLDNEGDRSYNIKRNYDVQLFGPTFFAEGIVPVFRWFNISGRFAYMMGSYNRLTQDIAGFPVWMVNDQKLNYIETRRILVESWAQEDSMPHMFHFNLQTEFLISKRISLIIGWGYLLSTDFTPLIYEVGGNRNYAENEDENGTFQELHNFNFARTKINEDRVKMNFTGFTVNMGLSINF